MTEKRSAIQLIADATKIASEADVVIFIGGLNKNEHQDSEGNDRQSLELPHDQDKLIDALSKANKNLAVVFISGNAVAMPWLNNVSAIVKGWFGGISAGNTIAAVSMGDINPDAENFFNLSLYMIINKLYIYMQVLAVNLP